MTSVSKAILEGINELELQPASGFRPKLTYGKAANYLHKHGWIQQKDSQSEKLLVIRVVFKNPEYPDTVLGYDRRGLQVEKIPGKLISLYRREGHDIELFKPEMSELVKMVDGVETSGSEETSLIEQLKGLLKEPWLYRGESPTGTHEWTAGRKLVLMVNESEVGHLSARFFKKQKGQWDLELQHLVPASPELVAKRANYYAQQHLPKTSVKFGELREVLADNGFWGSDSVGWGYSDLPPDSGIVYPKAAWSTTIRPHNIQEWVPEMKHSRVEVWVDSTMAGAAWDDRPIIAFRVVEDGEGVSPKFWTWSHVMGPGGALESADLWTRNLDKKAEELFGEKAAAEAGEVLTKGDVYGMLLSRGWAPVGEPVIMSDAVVRRFAQAEMPAGVWVEVVSDPYSDESASVKFVRAKTPQWNTALKVHPLTKTNVFARLYKLESAYGVVPGEGPKESVVELELKPARGFRKHLHLADVDEELENNGWKESHTDHDQPKTSVAYYENEDLPGATFMVEYMADTDDVVWMAAVAPDLAEQINLKRELSEIARITKQFEGEKPEPPQPDFSAKAKGLGVTVHDTPMDELTAKLEDLGWTLLKSKEAAGSFWKTWRKGSVTLRAGSVIYGDVTDAIFDVEGSPLVVDKKALSAGGVDYLVDKAEVLAGDVDELSVKKLMGVQKHGWSYEGVEDTSGGTSYAFSKGSEELYVKFDKAGNVGHAWVKKSYDDMPYYEDLPKDVDKILYYTSSGGGHVEGPSWEHPVIEERGPNGAFKSWDFGEAAAKGYVGDYGLYLYNPMSPAFVKYQTAKRVIEWLRKTYPGKDGEPLPVTVLGAYVDDEPLMDGLQDEGLIDHYVHDGAEESEEFWDMVVKGVEKHFGEEAGS